MQLLSSPTALEEESADPPSLGAATTAARREGGESTQATPVAIDRVGGGAGGSVIPKSNASGSVALEASADGSTIPRPALVVPTLLAATTGAVCREGGESAPATPIVAACRVGTRRGTYVSRRVVTTPISHCLDLRRQEEERTWEGVEDERG